MLFAVISNVLNFLSFASKFFSEFTRVTGRAGGEHDGGGRPELAAAGRHDRARDHGSERLACPDSELAAAEEAERPHHWYVHSCAILFSQPWVDSKKSFNFSERLLDRCVVL